MPKAAEMFRQQVEQGLDGDPRAATKARVMLREWFCGRIDSERKGDELWAVYGTQPAALLQVVGSKGLGNRGSGGRIASDIPLRRPRGGMSRKLSQQAPAT